MKLIARLFGWLSFLLVVPVLPAAEVAFASVSYAAALEKGTAENKLVFLYFEGPWSSGCQRLSRETFKHRKLISVLAKRTVPLRCNVLQTPELTQQFAIRSVPAMLLLNTDGFVLARWDGFRPGYDLADFVESFFFKGNEGDFRATLKASDHRGQLDLSDRLLATRAYDRALEKLLIVYRTAFAEDTFRKQGDRRRTVASVVSHIKALAPYCPEAMASLRRLADEEEEAVVTLTKNQMAAKRLIVVLDALEERDRVKDILSRVPPKSRGYESLNQVVRWPTLGLPDDIRLEVRALEAASSDVK